MNVTKPFLQYSVTAGGEEKIPVIIVAAGSASRMGGINKQTLEISGLPVIARTVAAFEKSIFVSKIILVCKEDDVFKMQSIVNAQKFGKVTDIVSGGSDRHASVLCGMERLSKSDKKVLIHDGARPFVTENMIADCVLALKDYKGCLCCVKVSDTVKQANDDGTVKKTVDRSMLYLAQTPQGVWVEEYLKASKQYAETVFTDDASVLEAAGYPVKIVSGGKNNIKITTPDDVKIAEGIIERENL